MSEKTPSNPARRSFQAPKGTRDFYPQEMLRRRYITDAWRRVSLRHGFEEIDGPTFEHLDLYTVKSGEGIVSELFSFQRAGGDDTYALRPEFTPTLARMYAARAQQLPQPTKWFCIPNFFRAERPQRGRLREFFQWNCDVVGGRRNETDAEMMGCSLNLFGDLGLDPIDLRLRMNHTQYASFIPEFLKTDHARTMTLLDQRRKMPQEEFLAKLRSLGASEEKINAYFVGSSDGPMRIPPITEPIKATDSIYNVVSAYGFDLTDADEWPTEYPWLVDMDEAYRALQLAGNLGWCDYEQTLTRGLAYYTGMVFEVIAEGERAVAGGGRYDNLIELFGGPPTPACGFGMGDVVLGNLLEDKGLIPEGRDLLEALSRPMPIRPDAFIISSGKDGTDEQVTPLVARLRRGVETQRYTDSQASDDAAKRMKPWDAARYDVSPLHARRSYKATKNVGKLLGEANNAHARYAVIIESAETCSLKNLESGEQTPDILIPEVGARIARA